ncbi:MAG TPA: PQQ-dependent catabolism-associated CXXCW motif protein [Hyphomicrobium sp.]|nr:PQQ-dependent catabolism-associated CXXCW motif protein [Hyphomicrobium sp.]HVZ06029.1 PQQ-dependent catabolism-associated CXXCW motif protein [Hyphomicrobium sp.]
MKYRGRHIDWFVRCPMLAFSCFMLAYVLPGAARAAGIAISSADSQAAVQLPPEPEAYRTDHYRSPVPLTLHGATVLSDEQAQKLWSEKSAVFIDVYPHPPKPAGLPAGTLWRETTHRSIENAVWLPNVGYGVLSPKIDAYFRRNLKTLTHGDKSKELVFFCLKNCWMSWNAAKRALSYGYTNIDWYRDGSDGWQESGGFLDEVHPLP